MLAFIELVTRRWRAALVLVVGLTMISSSMAFADHRSPFDGTQHDYGEMVQYDLVFPVAGDYTLRDTFYASRTNGDHHAQDIMADKMVPIVAAASGTIRYINWTRDAEAMWTNGRCCTMVITHDDGWETWYIHMNNDTPGTDDGQGWGIADGLVPGSRVEAGQLIGWVGDSGNAEYTPPHLHFELYDPEGVLVNPYNALLAAADPTCEGEECYPFVPLRRGDRGSRVTDLQTMLDTLGHDPGPIDGIFGGLTETAVESYQGAASLPIDGVVDEETWDSLLADFVSWEPPGSAVAIADPGFETGSVASSPHGFQASGGSWSIDAGAARSDSYGATYDSTGQSDLAVLEINGPKADGSDHIGVEPGQAVGFSFWVRADGDGTANRVRPRIEFLAADGDYIDGIAHTTVRPTGDWQQVSVTGVAPSGTVFVTFELRVHDDGNSGVFEFDDLGLLGPASPGEQVQDSGFESGGLSEHAVTDGGGLWSAAAEGARSGSFGASFDATSQASMAILWVNGAREDAADHVPVAEGQVVGFSAWVSSDDGSNRIRPRIHFYDSSGRWLDGATPGVVTPTAGWQEISAAGVAPQGSAFAIFQIRIHSDGTGGRYFIDDVSLIGVNDPIGGVTDSGFESGTLDSFSSVGSSWTASATAARTGSFGAAFDTSGQTEMAILWANGARRDPNHVNVQPGDLVGFSAWVAADTDGATNRTRPRIQFYDADWTYLDGVTMNVVRPDTGWRSVEVAGVAPQGSAFAVFQLRIHADGRAATIFLDDLEPAGAQASPSGPPDIEWDGTRVAEQWRPLVEYVFAMWGLDEEKCGEGDRSNDCIGDQVDNAIIIMQCESFGDPTIVNQSSGTTGLFQHRPVYWPSRTARVRNHFPDFPTDASAYDPYENVMVAALLVHESRDALLGYNSLTGPWDDGPEPWGHWDGSSRHCADPPLVSP